MNELWGIRAGHNMVSLLRAMDIHREYENERKIKEGKKFSPAELKIRLSIPNQELIDSAEDLEVVGIDPEGMSICVVESHVAQDILTHILVGDIMLIGFVDRYIQEKMRVNVATASQKEKVQQ